MTHDQFLRCLGEHVMLHRRRLGLSQERLAERTDLSRNAIGLIERGEVSPTISTVFALAFALNVPPSVLVAELEARIEGPFALPTTRKRDRL